MSGLRAAGVRAAVLFGLLSVASAGLAERWQLTPHLLAMPSGLVTVAAATLAGAVFALLASPGWLGRALTAGPLLRRAAALRRKSWGAAFQRQLNPDAAGRARPRAPTAAPAAA